MHKSEAFPTSQRNLTRLLLLSNPSLCYSQSHTIVFPTATQHFYSASVSFIHRTQNCSYFLLDQPFWVIAATQVKIVLKVQHLTLLSHMFLNVFPDHFYVSVALSTKHVKTWLKLFPVWMRRDNSVRNSRSSAKTKGGGALHLIIPQWKVNHKLLNLEHPCFYCRVFSLWTFSSVGTVSSAEHSSSSVSLLPPPVFGSHTQVILKDRAVRHAELFLFPQLGTFSVYMHQINVFNTKHNILLPCLLLYAFVKCINVDVVDHAWYGISDT